jgi:hypothetical protein
MGQLKVYIRIAQLSAGNNKAVFKPVTLGQDFVGKQIFQGDAAKVDENQPAAKVLDLADEGPLARQDDPVFCERIGLVVVSTSPCPWPCPPSTFAF